MPIEWDPAARQWHLRNERMSVILAVLENGELGQLYLGSALTPGVDYRHLARGPFHGWENRVGAPIRLELPTPDTGDYRQPALAVDLPDGSQAMRLRVRDHRILRGKPALAGGMPATYVEDDVEADTLEVDLVDERTSLVATVRLTLFRDHPALARSITVRNDGDAPVTLRTLMSASLDMPGADWERITLHGSWVRERHVTRAPLTPGRYATESLRGSSSLVASPFMALVRPSTTEAAGEAIGVSLVWSGDFLADVEVDQYATTRLRMGLHPDSFAWHLAPGDSFTSPEAVVVHATDGLGAMSEAFHRLYRSRLARGEWRDRVRPILINNWEATYFDFDEDRIVDIARVAAELGIELFCLDDGWFGRRDSDDRSLGDWVVDRRKLPNGLETLARRIRDLGMTFGIWIEPEMVSADSDLFRAHPDWAIGVPGLPRTESRQQLVLDLGRTEVVDHLAGALSAILSSAPIDYVKWDMNRTMTESWSGVLPAERQGEMRTRNILGVYELYRRLTERFPHILFESCASGGGRFDAGMLAFAPQAWTSDDTDAVERLRIQWGTSMVFPVSSMGAHVAAVPNHQTGRITPLATRAAVAAFGAFGYELDLTALSTEERAQVTDQVAWVKAHRETLQRGRFLRLIDPFAGNGNDTAWMCVSDDAHHAVVGWYRVLSRPVPGPSAVRLRGLDPARRYQVRVWPETDDTLVRRNSLVRGGDELMTVGLFLDDEPREAGVRGDFQARLFELEAV
ncbi:MAG: alpha-galactosidase [Chloroflexi bacterium]|nr:alpha-galactosidase [Chloroflexota bacterium]